MMILNTFKVNVASPILDNDGRRPRVDDVARRHIAVSLFLLVELLSCYYRVGDVNSNKSS